MYNCCAAATIVETPMTDYVTKQPVATSCLFMLFCVFVLFFNLGGRTLENTDYLHYAEIGREIIETGDWVIMHDGGRMYVDKPPLHSLHIALAFKLFGVNTFSARFPSALLALIGAAAAFFWGMRLDGKNIKTGIYTALLLLSSYGFFWLSRRPRNDVEYSVLFSLCLIFFYEGYAACSRRSRTILYCLFWIILGLAVLIKGPAGFLPLLIIVVFLAFQKGWKQAGLKHFFFAMPLLFVVVMPYLVMLVQHPQFPEFLIALKNKVIMTRSGGPLYYIPVFFTKFFPASILLACVAPVLWRQREAFRNNPRLAFALIWACVYLFIIHLVKAKVYRYLLPSFIPLAAITAWGMQQILPKLRLPHKLMRWWPIPAAAVCIGFPIVICVMTGWSWTALELGLVSAAIFFLFMKIDRDPVIFICLCCIFCLLFIDVFQTGNNEKVSDVRNLYRALEQRHIRPEEIATYRTGRMRVSLCFYFSHILPDTMTSGELHRQAGAKAVITNPEFKDEVVGVYGSYREEMLLKNHQGDEGHDRCVLFY